MFSSLAKPSDEAAKAMEQMGFKAYDSQHKMKSLSELISDLGKSTANMTEEQKQNTIATLFGQEAMSGILTLIKSGASGLDDLTNSYKKSDGAAKDMAKTMQDNAKSSIEQMVGSMETAAIKVEEAFAPSIRELADYIGNLADQFAKLTPEQQMFYVKMLGGAAAIGPVVKLLGGLTTGIGGVMKITGKITPLLFGTSAATSALGVETAATTGLLSGLGIAGGATVGALALLGVGIAGVVTHNELMSKSVNTSTDDLNAWEKVINSVTGNTIKSKDELQEAKLAYKDFGENIGDDFKKKVEESTKAIGEFSLFVSNINFDEALTESETSEFNSRVNKLVSSAIETIKARQKETQTEMSKLFMTDDNAIDNDEKKTLEALNAQGEESIKKVTENQKSIQQIYTDGIKARGYLNDEEKAAIKQRYAEIARLELEASQEAKNKYEKDYAKNEFKNRSNNLSAEDGSTLLKDQKSKLDEQRIKDATTYDTKLEELNDLVKTQSGVEAEATQRTIDKFTEKKNKVAELEKEQWLECIATIEEQNPKLVGVYNKYTGDILSTKDKEKNETLKIMQDTYTGMNSITESGMYSLYNTSSGTMEDVYVSIDKTTGDMVATYGTASGSIGGYTQQMSKDAQKTAQEMAIAYGKVKQNLDTATSASVNASGEMINQNGQVISKLGELQEAEDGTFYRMMDLNGTPIKIETNAEGTSVDLNGVKESVDNIPLGKTITTETNADETKNKIDNVTTSIDNVPEHHQTFFEALLKGNAWDYIKGLLGMGGSVSADASISNNYTGTNGWDEGLSFVNEHGWEMSSGANEVAMLGSGSKIVPHMTSVNEMRQEVAGQVGNTITPIIRTLTNVLGQVANNTGAIKTYTKETASNIIDSMNSTGGTFGTLQSQLDNANYEKDKVSNMSVEDNQAYIDAKAEVDRISDMTSDAKKALGEEELKIQKDNAEKSLDIAKKTAELDIIIAKQNADEKVRIAEANKDKLIKISEAVSTALKAQLEKEKATAEKAINDELTAMENTYNNKVAKIEAKLKSDTSDIDKQIAELEQQSTDTSREDTRTESNNNINMLKTKMANTKSQADKDALALQIKDAQKSMSKQEDTWNIEDEKAKLEEEKAILTEKAQAKKDNLQEEYEDAKASKEKELKSTDEYYDKLLETEYLNAQTRYKMLTASNDELVALLNSYAPGWQNAGQSLADSLLTGLNSSKQSVQDAVNDIVALRGSISIGGTNPTGYATGTSYNKSAGLYNVDEKGWETSSGSVAYVSKGAAINNHMQSVADMKAEITRQVSAMKNSINAEQSAMKSLILGSIASSTNSLVTHNDNGLTLSIDKFINNSSNDIEQIANELNTYSNRQKKA